MGKTAVRSKLTGKQLKFYDIAGRERNETVTADMITSIELTEKCSAYAKKKCWVASIQNRWKIYYGETMLEELGVEQLFVT